jgi:hypothetical protein
VLLASCAGQPERPECRAEYAHTIDYCNKRRPLTEQEMKDRGYVRYCEMSGGERCTWVSRAELDRILKPWPRGPY